MKREELITKAVYYYDLAKKIERSIKWQNDADRDFKIGKRDKALFEAFWCDVQAKELNYGRN